MLHNAFTLAPVARERTIRPFCVSRASCAAATRAGLRVGRNLDGTHAVARRAGHAQAGINSGSLAEGARGQRRMQFPCAPSAAHLAGRQGRHEVKGIAAFAATKSANYADAGLFTLGFVHHGCSVSARRCDDQLASLGHAATPSFASRRSRRSLSRRFSSSS